MLLRDRLHIPALACILAVCGLACDDELAVLPGGIEGRACHPDTGLGLPGAVIEARGPTDKRAAADVEGRFAFTGLAPGEYEVVALLDDGEEHRVGPAKLEVKSDAVTPADDTACSGDPGQGGRGDLDGQVCDRHTGGFVSDAEVIVLLANGEQMTGRTDATGTFSIADVPEGDHVVTIRAPGFQRSFPITIVTGQTFTIDIADNCDPPSSTSGAIAGEFCDPATDGALAGAEVVVHRTAPPSTPDEDIRELTDTDGRFFVAGLLPGSYRVTVSRDDIVVTALVDVSSGETATVAGPDECARRTPVGRIVGQICDEDAGGRFVGQVELLQGPTRVAVTDSDSEGRFAFNTVAPGTYDLRAFRADYERIFRAVVVEPFQTAVVQETDCPAPEDICTPFTHEPDLVSDGRILFVVDRSGSMAQVANGFGGVAKIDALRTAVEQVTTSLAPQVTYGLFAYPNPGDDGTTVNCGPGVQRQAMGANATQINNALDQLTPNGGTPTAESVRAARRILPNLVDDGRPIAVVLATDGAPNCATTSDELVACTCTSNVNGQSNTSCADFNCLDDANSAAAVAEVAALGVKTHVIGIRGVDENLFDGNGNGVPDFNEALNAMAIAGQAPLSGAKRFHDATSTAALTAALDAITRRILACQITVDENLTTASSVTVTLGDDVLAQDITRRDGWDATGPNTIELFGASCDAATASQDRVVVTRCEPPR